MSTPALRKIALLVSFAHCLLIDTTVSARCRFLAFAVLVDQDRQQGVCEELVEVGAGRRSSCRTALDAVQALVRALLAGSRVGQGGIAVLMRRYGREVEQRQRQRRQQQQWQLFG